MLLWKLLHARKCGFNQLCENSEKWSCVHKKHFSAYEWKRHEHMILYMECTGISWFLVIWKVVYFISIWLSELISVAELCWKIPHVWAWRWMVLSNYKNLINSKKYWKLLSVQLKSKVCTVVRSLPQLFLSAPNRSN